MHPGRQKNVKIELPIYYVMPNSAPLTYLTGYVDNAMVHIIKLT